jgi:cysteine sulfinate desulfinase/cysteine desulfurase-like protein
VNNLAIKGMAFACWGIKNHIITSAIEHPSVIQTCKWLERYGFKTTYLEVDETGRISPDDLISAITDQTCLISIMLANNETGTIQPVADLALIAKSKGIPFHTDATQAIGKIQIDIQALGVDMLTMSGHKFYGPKGIGVLYVGREASLEPLIHGGKQESGLRAGTENLAGIAGLGKAAELAMQRITEMERIRALRDRLEKGIRELVPEARLNGHREERLPNTLNMTLPGLRGESLVLALDQKGISLSSGSACRSGSPTPSHALLAMGLTEEEAHCSIRLSLGLGNTEKDIDDTIIAFREVLNDARSTIQFVPCR